MSDTSFLALAALAGIPLSGVISGVIVSTFTASRNVYVQSITAERNKWLEKLRANIAAHATEVRAIGIEMAIALNLQKKIQEAQGFDDDTPVGVPGFSTDKIVVHYRTLQGLSSLIQLQLNPKGAIDQNIIAILTSNAANDLKDNNRLGLMSRLLIQHAQFLLKDEWEKVKFEAGGIMYRHKHKKDEEARLKEYVEWTAGRGSIERLFKKKAEK